MNQMNQSYGGQSFPAHYDQLFRHDRMDISYLVLQNFCERPRVHPVPATPMSHLANLTSGERLHRGPPHGRDGSSRNLFYDLGCGNYSRADGAPVDIKLGQGLGPSIPLFTCVWPLECTCYSTCC